MSLAGVHLADISSSLDHLEPRSLSSASLDELGLLFNGDASPNAGLDLQYGDNMLTIEELRAQLSSCFSCGVSWAQQHVSLDCSECGGYALERPCPLCDAKCGQMWKRDLNVSHACSKARWQGVCKLSERPNTVQCYPAPLAPLHIPPQSSVLQPHPLPPHCSTAARLAHELCQRLEILASQQRPS